MKQTAYKERVDETNSSQRERWWNSLHRERWWNKQLTKRELMKQTAHKESVDETNSIQRERWWNKQLTKRALMKQTAYTESVDETAYTESVDETNSLQRVLWWSKGRRNRRACRSNRLMNYKGLVRQTTGILCQLKPLICRSQNEIRTHNYVWRPHSQSHPISSPPMARLVFKVWWLEKLACVMRKWGFLLLFPSSTNRKWNGMEVYKYRHAT